MKIRTRKIVSTTIYHIFMVIFGLVMLYPVIWMIFSSLKNPREVMTIPTKFFSDRFYFENYVNGWQGVGNNTFKTFFTNSFFISLTATIGTVVASALVAYGFARIKFPLKKFWFTCMILTMMLPYQIIMVPQFVIFDKLNWTNSNLPLIVPAFGGGAFFIFLIMQFISGIPGELDQAAKIDGCGRYGIFFRVILPLIK
ncbi:MAG: carbohydrate ABC transporter permease, partial [Clostridia bacterium]|nr:carbohydrate ABC transporter permease [Clostridia bacterium]